MNHLFKIVLVLVACGVIYTFNPRIEAANTVDWGVSEESPFTDSSAPSMNNFNRVFGIIDDQIDAFNAAIDTANMYGVFRVYPSSVNIGNTAHSIDLSSHTAVVGNLTITGTTTGTGAGAFPTINTGQGANELYDMNQNVQTTDRVQFTGYTVTDATTTDLSATVAWITTLNGTTYNGLDANEILAGSLGSGVICSSVAATVMIDATQINAGSLPATVIVSSVAVNATGTKQLQQDIVNRNEGIITTPTIADVAGSSISLTACTALLRSTTYYGDSKLYKLDVTANPALVLTDNSLNFIYATYNSGSPIYAATTDITNINDSSEVHVANIYMKDGNIDYSFAFTGEGLAEASRNHNRVLRLRLIERESGLTISCSTMVVTVATGIVWYANDEISLSAIQQTETNSGIWYHSAGVWTKVSTSTINADKYDNLTSTASVGVGKYSVNWIYRNVASEEIDIVMGQGNYSLNQAENAIAPTPPSHLPYFYKLVGKIIIKKGDTTPTAVLQIVDDAYQQSSAYNHNDLANIDGGTYHITLSSYTALLYGQDSTALHYHNRVSSIAAGAITNSAQIAADVIDPATDIGAGILANDVIISSIAKGAITDNVLPGGIGKNINFSSSVYITGNTNLKTLKLLDSDVSHYCQFTASPTVATSYTMLMPKDKGTAAQALLTDGTDNMYWGSPTAVEDAVYTDIGWSFPCSAFVGNGWAYRRTLDTFTVTDDTGGNAIVIDFGADGTDVSAITSFDIKVSSYPNYAWLTIFTATTTCEVNVAIDADRCKIGAASLVTTVFPAGTWWRFDCTKAAGTPGGSPIEVNIWGFYLKND